MLRVGITGGIGSGKTTVCKIFELLGIPVFYADDESKKILLSSPEVIDQLREKFGREIFNNGHPDRKKISDLVFNNPVKLQLLNSILHPAVFKAFEEWVQQRSGLPYIIKEAALIYETGGEKILDKVIVVSAPEEMRIRRIRERDHITESEVQTRMDNQLPQEEKDQRADFIIYNDEEQLLIPQVLKIHESISALSHTP